MNRTWVGVAVALLLFVCSDSGLPGHTSPEPFTDFETLSVDNRGCIFDCPVFEVRIFSDGRVRHSGPIFAQTGGPEEFHIGRASLVRIANALREAHIDDMRDRYVDEADGCASVMTDQSTLVLHVNRGRGKRNKSVQVYTGCFGGSVPAERINALLEAIDHVTGTGTVVERRIQARPRGH